MFSSMLTVQSLTWYRSLSSYLVRPYLNMNQEPIQIDGNHTFCNYLAGSSSLQFQRLWFPSFSLIFFTTRSKHLSNYRYILSGILFGSEWFHLTLWFLSLCPQCLMQCVITFCKRTIKEFLGRQNRRVWTIQNHWNWSKICCNIQTQCNTRLLSINLIFQQRKFKEKTRWETSFYLG